MEVLPAVGGPHVRLPVKCVEFRPLGGALTGEPPARLPAVPDRERCSTTSPCERLHAALVAPFTSLPLHALARPWPRAKPGRVLRPATASICGHGRGGGRKSWHLAIAGPGGGGGGRAPIFQKSLYEKLLEKILQMKPPTATTATLGKGEPSPFMFARHESSGDARCADRDLSRRVSAICLITPR
jgi:hypothetical protein